VAVFQFENYFFDSIGIAKGDDDSLQVSIFFRFTIEASFVVGRKSVAKWANLWMRDEILFTCFTQIISLFATRDTVSGKYLFYDSFSHGEIVFLYF